MTNIQKRFLDLVEQSQNVLMCISVDVRGHENEYIRGASLLETSRKKLKNILCK